MTDMNLIELCERRNPLSLIEKIAIKEDVSFNFEYLLNSYIRNESKASKLFGVYRCLIKTNPSLYGNYIDEIIEQGYADEDDINNILVYIRSGILPYHLWVDKLITDIKTPFFYNKTSIQGLLTVYLLKTLRCSLIGFNKVVKALLEEDLSDDLVEAIEFAKVKYAELPKEIKSAYAKAYNSETEEERRKFQDNELSLFTEILSDQLKAPLNMNMIYEVAEMAENDYKKYTTPIWVELCGSMGVGATKVDSNGNPVATETAEQEQQRRQGMGIFLEDVLGYSKKQKVQKADEELQQQLAESDMLTQPIVEQAHEISNEHKTYVVKKIAKNGSTRVMSETKFNSKHEAEQFKRNIEQANPEICKLFDFVVEVVE